MSKKDKKTLIIKDDSESTYLLLCILLTDKQGEISAINLLLTLTCRFTYRRMVLLSVRLNDYT